MSMAFFITALLVVASPGTGALYTISASLSQGVRAGLVAAAGCTLGILPHMLAAVLGLATVFRTSALAFEVLKIVGAAYLLYMAWQALRDARLLEVGDGNEKKGAVKIIASAVMVNLLNPKLPVFFLAFLPQFVAADDPSPITTMLALSAVFMAMTWVVFAIYGVFAAMMRKHVLTRPAVLTWMRRSFAAGFAVLGLRLLVSQR
ncbi:LysE family translocator [Dyella japonica]|uniref:Lysine transporter LysE n=1 Tax=Dyella japonica A8 TaxID=1217721 RepID=A0A075JW39_9GAMM|nr:LysE family translocator [Dyella japonica]AIF46089.1 lysine transporter LysE [Dyella japonica A8]